jgi:hypothetical protein
MRIVVPLSHHPTARGSSMQLVWKNEKTGDAVLAVGVGFIAAIGRTGTVFIDTFATLAEAQTALVQYHSPGFSPLPE